VRIFFNYLILRKCADLKSVFGSKLNLDKT